MFFDFDGTLVEIAEHPDAVVVDPNLPALLRAIRAWLDGALAIVSGRPIADIDRFLGDGIAAVAGLHGLERRTAAGVVSEATVPRDALAIARRRLNDFAKDRDGVLVEDKRLSVALHFRQAPAQAADCRQAAAAAARASGDRLRVLPGKMVFELRPDGGDKGDAIAAFMAEAPFRGRVPVFIGDDVTDEHGFEEVRALGGVGILVGPARETAASERIDDVSSLYAWLSHFPYNRADS